MRFMSRSEPMAARPGGRAPCTPVGPTRGPVTLRTGRRAGTKRVVAVPQIRCVPPGPIRIPLDVQHGRRRACTAHLATHSTLADDALNVLPSAR